MIWNLDGHARRSRVEKNYARAGGRNAKNCHPVSWWVLLPYKWWIEKSLAVTRRATTLEKGWGRLIHVSDFVNKEHGRLVLRDDNDRIICDAHKIIYPGSNDDPWWDNKQLMDQIRSAMEIFEATHPDCQALFIFDRSSTHTSLPPDALKAFELNKSNGGAQRKQRDTIIPQSNLEAHFWGQPHKMTTTSGEAKGLKAVLEECGFDVSCLRAKCSPVCPFESHSCCLARLLSQQEDFITQKPMLETLIKSAGHECIFHQNSTVSWTRSRWWVIP